MKKSKMMTSVIAAVLAACLAGCSGMQGASVSVEPVPVNSVTTSVSETSVQESPASETSEPEAPDPETPEDDGDRFVFNTTDRDGNIFTDELFDRYSITMINLWEPWCGPCVGEMSELNDLYVNYRDKGFMLLGVYADTSMESDVDYILDMTGVTYPILLMSDEFGAYATEYVPTTFFVDKEGHIIDFGIDDPYSDGPQLIGARSYEGWEEIVKSYLDK